MFSDISQVWLSQKLEYIELLSWQKYKQKSNSWFIFVERHFRPKRYIFDPCIGETRWDLHVYVLFKAKCKKVPIFINNFN
jgi:hypothetical protein